MGKDKLSDTHPDLVGKLYCGDCLYWGLNRTDFVADGTHKCLLCNLFASESTKACKDIITKDWAIYLLLDNSDFEDKNA
jgi:hypothetical protein